MVEAITENGIGEFDPRLLYAQGIALGEADLIVGAPTDHVVGRSAALALAMRSEGKSLFSGVTLVLPPRGFWKKSQSEFLALVLEGIASLRGTPATSGEIESIRRRLAVLQCQTLDAEELIGLVSTVTNQFVIVPSAQMYRLVGAAEPVRLGKVGVVLPEDDWVPHLTAWTPECIAEAGASNSCLVLEVPENPPVDEANNSRLIAINGLYPSYFYLPDGIDGSDIPRKDFERWSASAASGRLDEALSEVAALNIAPEMKRQLEVQVIARGHDSARIRSAIQAYATDHPNMPSAIAVRLGRAAHRVDDDITAANLIAKGLDSITSQVLLEATLLTCTGIENRALEERAYRRLNELFPASKLLRSYRLHTLLRLSASTDLQPASDIPLTEYELEVANTFVDVSQSKINALLESSKSWPAEFRDLALVCCSNYAVSKSMVKDAIELAVQVTNPGEFDRVATKLLIAATKRMLLSERHGFDGPFDLAVPMSYVRLYVATHPEHPEIRESFAAIFEVESSGALGLSIMVSQTIGLARQGTALSESRQEYEAEASADDLGLFLERAEKWLNEKGILEVGFTRMPLEVIGADPRLILNALRPAIRALANSSEESDIAVAERFAFIAATVAAHVPDASVDINALRMVASRFAMQGRSQRARDLAEQILELAGKSAVRRRLAWAAFADIYHRCRNPIAALLGLACALELDQVVSPSDLWWEVYTLFRIFRDLRFISFARELLGPLRELQKRLPASERHEVRMNSLELGLRALDVEERDVGSLGRLVRDVASHCGTLLDDLEEILPAVALLAQVIGRLEEAGGEAPAEVRELLRAALTKIGEEQAKYVMAVSSSAPTIADAVYVYRRAESARYVDDVPGDLQASEMIARRVLRTDRSILPPESISTAIELLADRALDPLEGSRALDERWPLAFANSIRPEDGAVVMQALDADGVLVSLTIDELVTVVTTNGNSGEPFGAVLAEWGQSYPQRYGLIDRSEGNNEFFVSMEKLSLSLPPAHRIIVIAEPALQQIPLNLAVVDGAFAGDSRAIGYVPSLTWLDAMQGRPRVQGGPVAWIPEPGERVGGSALAMVLSRTEPTFKRFGFRLFTERDIPGEIAKASLAVVAAHGSVASTGRYFRRVSDEGDLIVSPTALAKALAGVEVVVLFVCSGGRTDRHPLVNTGVGLPKQLLSAGCRAVIASPWPLSPLITGPWLDAFMSQWSTGASVLDATFAANQAVAVHFGAVPQYSHAMTAYGDVLLRARC